MGRYFRVPEFSASPKSTVNINGYGYSADLLLPIIPAKSVTDGNALTLTASFVYGQAIADLYTGLSGGASFATLPANAMGMPQPYPQDVDNGLIAYTPDGVLHAIRWESYIIGAQYYFPTPKRLWLSANVSHMYSPDIDKLQSAPATPGGAPANAGSLWNRSYWADANLFVDLNPAVRFGLEYAYFWQKYLDQTKGSNTRVQFSAFYIF